MPGGSSGAPIVTDGGRFGEPVAQPDHEPALREERSPRGWAVGAADAGAEERGERLDVDVGMGEQVVQHRRDDRHPLHPLPLDPLGEADGVHPVDRHARVAVRERTQRTEDHQVQERERQAHPAPLDRPAGRRLGIQVACSCDDHHHVVLAVHRTLGVAGGTAGERDRRRRERIDVDDDPLVAVERREELCPLVVGSGGLGIDQVREPGQPVALRRHLLHRAAVGEEHGRVDVVEEEQLLRARQLAVDPCPDRAQPHRRQERDDERRVVPHGDGHAVSRADAQVPQAGGGPVHRRLQGRVVEAFVPAHERLPPRVDGEHAVVEVDHRLRARPGDRSHLGRRDESERRQVHGGHRTPR